MLHDAFADFKGQVQPRKVSIALLERFDDTQSLEIVIKASAEVAHDVVEALLARVSEGRMADVMDQSESFDQVDVEAHQTGDCAGNLGDLQGVGEAVAEMIRKAGGENLGSCLPDGEKRANEPRGHGRAGNHCDSGAAARETCARGSARGGPRSRAGNCSEQWGCRAAEPVRAGYCAPLRNISAARSAAAVPG